MPKVSEVKHRVRPYTTGEIAKRCYVHLRTVLQWIQDGKLKAYRTPGRHCRVMPEDLEKFLSKYEMPF